MKAPWTDQQVERLNQWQRNGMVHSFTCPGEASCPYVDGGYRALTATTAGWICPCGAYTQDWAHDFMMMEETMRDRFNRPIGKRPGADNLDLGIDDGLYNLPRLPAAYDDEDDDEPLQPMRPMSARVVIYALLAAIGIVAGVYGLSVVLR